MPSKAVCRRLIAAPRMAANRAHNALRPGLVNRYEAGKQPSNDQFFAGSMESCFRTSPGYTSKLRSSTSPAL